MTDAATARAILTADTIKVLRDDRDRWAKRAEKAEADLILSTDALGKAEAERDYAKQIISDNYHLDFDQMTRALRKAEAERDRYRAVVWAMIQQSVDSENEGMTEDDPDWEDTATFLDEHTTHWTPNVHGDVLKSLIAALAATAEDR